MLKLCYCHSPIKASPRQAQCCAGAACGAGCSHLLAWFWMLCVQPWVTSAAWRVCRSLLHNEMSSVSVLMAADKKLFGMVCSTKLAWRASPNSQLRSEGQAIITHTCLCLRAASGRTPAGGQSQVSVLNHSGAYQMLSLVRQPLYGGVYMVL